MILNPYSQGRREEYDGDALNKIADMAKRYVAGDDGNRYVKDSIPDGSFSDFSCSVWEIMVNLVRCGMKLAKESNKNSASEIGFTLPKGIRVYAALCGDAIPGQSGNDWAGINVLAAYPDGILEPLCSAEFVTGELGSDALRVLPLQAGKEAGQQVPLPGLPRGARLRLRIVHRTAGGREQMLICVDCGRVFDSPRRVVERHG